MLHRLAPSAEFLAFFRDVVLSIWDRKQSDAQAQFSAMQGDLEKLTVRNNTLMDKYLDGKINQSDCDQQNHSCAICTASAPLNAAWVSYPHVLRTRARIEIAFSSSTMSTRSAGDDPVPCASTGIVLGCAGLGENGSKGVS